MFNFENLHRNHKLAYLDGLLSGIVLTYIGTTLYKAWKEGHKLEAALDADEAKIIKIAK